jgi:hypothetical protein
MGHSSIQITVDVYGHLFPGANVCFVDQLDHETTRYNPQYDRNGASAGNSQI